jgi:trans-2,3-dihydro-3-hydroxyanthranilate isomerase
VTRLAWVDVFAAGPLTGTPVAVVLDADDWPARRMQLLAAELGVPETVVALPPAQDGDARLRIFTPRRELPTGGNPLVGAAWVLRAAGRTGGAARLETPAGVAAVRVRGGVATTDLGLATPGEEVDADEAAAALGAPGHAGAARIWEVHGGPRLLLPLADAAALRAAAPDHGALGALAERDGWLGLSAYAPPRREGGRTVVEARHFAPGGVPEDPVTGSAAGALGARLAAEAAGAYLSLVVRQRAATGRGGEVAVRVGGAGAGAPRVQVGGRVAPLFEGRLVDVADPAWSGRGG